MNTWKEDAIERKFEMGTDAQSPHTRRNKKRRRDYPWCVQRRMSFLKFYSGRWYTISRWHTIYEAEAEIAKMQNREHRCGNSFEYRIEEGR
jgi:hypothetical protein